MLRGSGHLIALGGASTWALLDQTGAGVLPGAGSKVGALRIVLTIETGTLAGLAQGAILTVASYQYRVRESRAIEDGLLTRIFCERT